MAESETHINKTISIHFNQEEVDRGIPGSFVEMVKRLLARRVKIFGLIHAHGEMDEHGLHETVTAAKSGQYHCGTCGGSSLQTVSWRDVHTEEVHDDFGSWDETDTNYCNDCSDHCEIIDEYELRSRLATKKEG